MYWNDRLHDSFYTCTLPWLAHILINDGHVYLPFHHQIFIKLMQHVSVVAPIYSIQLITYEKSNQLNLVKATDLIPPDHMEDYFGKTGEQQCRQILHTGWTTLFRESIDSKH